MSNLNIDQKYYIGRSENGGWASVYAYKPRNPHILEEKGEIFSVISVKGPRGFSANTAGNLLLDFMHESYFEGEDRSPLLCLEKALIKTANKLIEIVDHDKRISDTGLDLDITAITIVDRIAYFANMGDGGIFLFREGNLINVNSALRDPTGDKLVKSASTVVKIGDVLLLVTPYGYNSYTKDEIIEACNEFKELNLKNKPLEDESTLAFLMIGIELEHKQEDIVLSEQISANKPQEQKIQQEILTKDKLEEDHDDVPELDEEQQEMHGKSILNKAHEYLFGVQNKIKNLEINKKIKNKLDGLKPKDTQDTTFIYYFKKVRDKAIIFFSFLKRVVWDEFLQMKQGMYLRNARRGTNWRLVIVLVVVGVLVLIICINTISANQERSRKEREIEETIEKVSKDIGKMSPEIDSILGIVDIYNRERPNYQTKINQARNDLNRIKEYNISSDQIESLFNKIRELENKLNRKVIINDPNIIVDFVTVDENSNPSDMEIINNKIYISDQNRGVIYSMDYSGGGFTELVKNLNNPKSLIVNGAGELIGADTNIKEPFFLVNLNNGSINRLTGLVGEGFDSIIELEQYKDRIYFLKTVGTQVQYIVKAGAGYAGATDRLSDPSFSSAKDIEISDGEIYLLLPGEGAIRYSGDTKLVFNLFGLSDNEMTKTINSTAFDVDGLYVVYGSSSGHSIVLATKSSGDDTTISNYVTQIVYSGDMGYLSDIKEVKIDRENGYIFVLDSTRLIRYRMSDIQKFLF